MDERDEYDLFLDNWRPGERLLHATLAQNINDPYSRKRLLDDSTGEASVERAPFALGQKIMDDDELVVRAFQFFEDHHDEWAAHFRDYVLDKGVPKEKFDSFVTSFAELWVDGRKRRQESPQILSIKASIRDLDLLRHPSAGRFVINRIDSGVAPLFTPDEMGIILDANKGLIEALLPNYIGALGDEGPSSLGDLYVRRGVYMPHLDTVRHELHYLSSYSLGLGPVEQFAQTWTPDTKDRGFPSIFSAPVSAIQHRVVAFAPFVEGMDLAQLEFVVAPPSEETPLQEDGIHGGIHEFSFR